MMPWSKRIIAIWGLCGVAALASAAEMQTLDDEALSDVRGRDGLSFGANLNANIGSATLGMSDSLGNPTTLSLNNLTVTGTVAWALDVISGTSGSPGFVNLAYPDIGGTNNLQIFTNMAITAEGSTFGTGISLQNMAFNGSSMQWTPATVGGINFGLSVGLEIGNILLQPNGVGNTSGQMNISGIQIGAAGNAGNPWVLADIAAQPGIFNVNTDASGNPYVQMGIGWPTSGSTAQAGSLQLGNIAFNTPNGNVNIGSSSIGSMQIQYLNIKLKP